MFSTPKMLMLRALAGISLPAMFMQAYHEKRLKGGTPAPGAPTVHRGRLRNTYKGCAHPPSVRGDKKREGRARHVAAVRAQQGTPIPRKYRNGWRSTATTF